MYGEIRRKSPATYPVKGKKIYFKRRNEKWLANPRKDAES